MIRMRQVFSFLLAVALLSGLCACGGSIGDTATAPTSNDPEPVTSSDTTNSGDSPTKGTMPIVEVHKPVIKIKERYGMLSGQRYLSSRTQYNEAGKTVQIDHFKSDGTCESIEVYEWDDSGSVWINHTRSYTENSNIDEIVERELDEDGRIKTVTSKYGYNSNSLETTVYEYDEYDNIISETITASVTSEIITVDDITWILIHEYDYNTNGEKVREKVFRGDEIDSISGAYEYGVNGITTEREDTLYEYENGKLIRTRKYSYINEAYAPSKYTYNSNDQLVAIVIYDTTEINITGIRIYDNTGSSIYYAPCAERSTQYDLKYNTDGLVEECSLFEAAGVWLRYSFEYDFAGNVTKVTYPTGYNINTLMVDGYSTIEYEYEYW